MKGGKGHSKKKKGVSRRNEDGDDGQRDDGSEDGRDLSCPYTILIRKDVRPNKEANTVSIPTVDVREISVARNAYPIMPNHSRAGLAFAPLNRDSWFAPKASGREKVS
jgi:hypothetical protein